MYFKECNMYINQFDISVNVLFKLIEKEFEEDPEFKNIISYEDILKIVCRTSILANTCNILLESYIKLVIQSYIVYDKFLKNYYSSIISMNAEQAGNYLRTLIYRLCHDKEGNFIGDFLSKFNNIIKEHNNKTNMEEQILYCENIIGKRNALVLHVMLLEFYR